MSGDVALARGFYILVGSARAVACGKQALYIRFHFSVYDDVPVLNFKSVNQRRGRKRAFKNKQPVNLHLTVAEIYGGKPFITYELYRLF